MKVASNRISDVRLYIKERLQALYPVEEIQSFTFILFEHYCGMSMAQVLANTRETINESELLLVYDAVKELELYRPIQHILGKTVFYGLNLSVNHHVLIPRPETEELVELAVKQNYYKPGLKILDIGTGSGCIAIALKKNIPEAEVTAIDISADALKVAQQNALKNETEIRLICSDILDETQWAALDAYDIIVSNPPYVLESEKARMQPNVLNFEPASALFVADDNALMFYDAIFRFAKSKQRKCAVYLEINESKANELISLAKEYRFSGIEIVKDINSNQPPHDKLA